MNLVDVLDKYIFQGITGETAFTLLERFLRQRFSKGIEDLYLDAAQEISEQVQPFWSKKYGGNVYLDREALKKLLRYDLATLLDESSISELTQPEFIRQLAQACVKSEQPALILENRVLSEEDYQHLLTVFFQAVQQAWKRKIQEHPNAFAQVVIEESIHTNIRLEELFTFLESRFEFSQDLRRKIEELIQRQRREELERIKLDIREREREIQRLRIQLIVKQSELSQLINKLNQQGESIPISSTYQQAASYNLPRPVIAFVKRPQYFDSVIESLDLHSKGWGVAIDGISGVGKTSMATEVAHYCLREGLFERIIWTSAQHQPLDFSVPIGEYFYEFEGLLDEIIRSFDCVDVLEAPVDEKRRISRNLLSSVSSCLLIIDNLETVENFDPIARFLRTTPFSVKSITTTRKKYLGQGEILVHLPPMTLDEVRNLVHRLCDQKKGIDIPDEQIEDLYEIIGGIPLAIVWSIGQYRRPLSGINFLGRLRQIRLTGELGEREHQLLEFCFREAYNALNKTSQKVLDALGLFSIPLCEDDLRIILELSRNNLWDALDELDTFSLIQSSTPHDKLTKELLSVLPLTRLFVRSELFREKSDFVQELCRRYAEHRVSHSRICVFTPDYQPVELPQGATVLDFAYYVHTEVGHRFDGAKVNSEAVHNIDYRLHNGDIVEIITSRSPKPEEKWLDFVITERAERSIRAWFRRPERAIKAVRRGNTLSLQCNTAKAESEYLNAVKFDPANTWAYCRLGHLARLAGNNDRASQLYRTALSLEHSNPFAYEGLACIRYQTRQFIEAVGLYQKALNIKPNYVNALLGLSRCFCALGQYTEAYKILERAFEGRIHRRQLPVLHFWCVIAQLGLGNFDVAAHVHLSKALSEFNRIVPEHRLKEAPFYGSHMLYYYSIALACGSSQTYERYLERAIEICKLPGLISEILVDINLLQPALVDPLEKIVRQKFPNSTIKDKLYKINIILQAHAAVAQ